MPEPSVVVSLVDARIRVSPPTNGRAALRRQERRVLLDVEAPADRPAAFWAADRQGSAVSAIEIPNGFHGAFQNAPTAVKQALDYLL